MHAVTVRSQEHIKTVVAFQLSFMSSNDLVSTESILNILEEHNTLRAHLISPLRINFILHCQEKKVAKCVPLRIQCLVIGAVLLRVLESIVPFTLGTKRNPYNRYPLSLTYAHLWGEFSRVASIDYTVYDD